MPIDRALINRVLGVAVVAATIALGGAGAAHAESQAPSQPDPCTSPRNVIACENAQPGTARSTWDIKGVGDRTVQGFATAMSVQGGEEISFKIDTSADRLRIDIYRTGYYGGDGARRIDSIGPEGVVAVQQPECARDLDTGLIDCGNWSTSATWVVPANAVSGVYIARLERLDTGGASHIIFVVRDDERQADIVFQTADTTWQAYNWFGGENLYRGAPPRNRAYEVSYNRPFETREVKDGRDFYFSSEYAMVQFLEANGYDVSYVSGLDVDRDPALLDRHRVFMSVGHDEYWSGPQRANVERARDEGLHLGFFTGNEVYWRFRWAASNFDPGSEPRTIVCYKETWDSAKIDPSDEWTGTWRDRRFNAEGAGQPENALVGSLFKSNSGQFTIEVPREDGQLRFWRNTRMETLAEGQVGILAPNVLGYEFNADVDNGFRPPGLIRLSTTEKLVDRELTDYGGSQRPGVVEHAVTMYRADSGALVFGAGTIQWSWGFGYPHDGTTGAPDHAMRQATVNLLADMEVQPVTLAADLMRAGPSTDDEPPEAVIVDPGAMASVPGPTVTVRGTARDASGRVAAVEVSVDGGVRWHPAVGRDEWSFTFNPSGTGWRSVVARAVDDSGNIGPPSTPVVITADCPCTALTDMAPEVRAVETTTPTSVGTVFRTAVPVVVTGFRFFQGPGNEGPHTGRLWRSDGAELARVEFPTGTVGGWQTADLDPPIRLEPGFDYVVSYFAPAGAYAADPGVFTGRTPRGFPLAALDSVIGFGSPDVFPTLPADGQNFYVDVIARFATPEDPPIDISGGAATRSVVRAFDGWQPTQLAVPEDDPSQVGVRMRAMVPGEVTALRFFRGGSNVGPHTGYVWSAAGELLSKVEFPAGGADGWQSAPLSEPFRVGADEEWVVSYLAPRGSWSLSESDLLYPRTVGPLTALRSVYRAGTSERMPVDTLPGANYGVDVDFVPDMSAIDRR